MQHTDKAIAEIIKKASADQARTLAGWENLRKAFRRWGASIRLEARGLQVTARKKGEGQPIEAAGVTVKE